MSTQPTPAGAQPVRPQVVVEHGQPMRIILEHPPERRGRWLGRRLLWIGLGLSVLFNLMLFGTMHDYLGSDTSVEERYHSKEHFGTEKVAIISVEGTIMAGDGFVKKQIDRVREDDEVKAVVLRVDSPGGTVTGSDYIYHHLKELVTEKQIPLVVSMGSVAASGGYYVSMAAGEGEKRIFAEPTCWTGSIGVIIPHYDVSGLLARFDVSDDSIASAHLKQMGSPTRKLPEKEREEERAILKNLVDDSFAGFKQIVLDNRAELRKHPEWQEEAFTGRIFTAKQAKQLGLVDELGFIEKAIDRAIELGNLDHGKVRVVQYHHRITSLSEILLGAQSRSTKSLDLSALLDLSTPKAYYLCTFLPGFSPIPR